MLHTERRDFGPLKRDEHKSLLRLACGSIHSPVLARSGLLAIFCTEKVVAFYEEANPLMAKGRSDPTTHLSYVIFFRVMGGFLLLFGGLLLYCITKWG